MVKREPLKAGTKLWDRYTITEKIGEGASCLVYDAIFKDDCDIEYKVRIKECFPSNPAFSRNCSGEIVSKFDDITLEPFIKRYKKSYRNLVALRNRPALTNIIVSPRGLFDENNTVYTVFDVDQGKDYETILKENKAASNYGTLEKVFERFINIASAVDVFHNEYEQFSGSNSHCCLDLKPQNILIVNTNPETIKLFDLDSIISEDSSDNEVFLSEGFASSEQLTGDINQISKQSDIYAIGAMLYYVLFGKTYDCIDEINASNIEYSTMLFPDFQPLLKDELKEFFSKTLAIWPESRYSDFSSVTAHLKKLSSVSASIFSFSISETPYKMDIMLKEEIKELSYNLSPQNYLRAFTLIRYLMNGEYGTSCENAGKNYDFMLYVIERTNRMKEDVFSLGMSVWGNFYAYECSGKMEFYDNAKKKFYAFMNIVNEIGKYRWFEFVIPFAINYAEDISSAEAAFALVELLYPAFNNEDSEDIDNIDQLIKTVFQEARKKFGPDNEISIYLSIFEIRCFDCDHDKNLKDLFAEIEISYNKLCHKNYNLECAIKWVCERANMLRFDKDAIRISLNPQNYNEEETEDYLKRRFPKLMKAI